jgi:hypothetical protein
VPPSVPDLSSLFTQPYVPDNTVQPTVTQPTAPDLSSILNPTNTGETTPPCYVSDSQGNAHAARTAEDFASCNTPQTGDITDEFVPVAVVNPGQTTNPVQPAVTTEELASLPTVGTPPTVSELVNLPIKNTATLPLMWLPGSTDLLQPTAQTTQPGQKMGPPEAPPCYGLNKETGLLGPSSDCSSVYTATVSGYTPPVPAPGAGLINGYSSTNLGNSITGSASLCSFFNSCNNPGTMIVGAMPNPTSALASTVSAAAAAASQLAANPETAGTAQAIGAEIIASNNAFLASTGLGALNWGRGLIGYLEGNSSVIVNQTVQAGTCVLSLLSGTPCK